MVIKTAKVWLGGAAGVTAPIHLSQYDTGWKLQFSVYDGATVYQPVGVGAVILEGHKSDGTVFAVPGTFIDGVAVVDCNASITSAVGKIDCELRVTDGGAVVGTANFEIIIEKAPLTGYIASGDDFSAMKQVLDGAVAAANEAVTAAAVAQVQAGMAYKIAATGADMTDHSIGYVYVGDGTGADAGLVYGTWYYWNGTAWTAGGTSVDPTLLVAGAAADAKVTGENMFVRIIPVSFEKNGGYYTTTGAVSTTGTTTYWHADVPVSNGDVIHFYYRDCPTSVSIAGRMVGATFSMLLRGKGTTGYIDATLNIDFDGTLMLSGRYADTGYIAEKTFVNNNAITIFNAVELPIVSDALNKEIPWAYMLEDVICIGDSLTVGVPSSTASMPNPLKQNYPFYLARMLGLTATNAGVGGIRTKNWYNEQYGNYTMSDYRAAIIFLGTNGGLTDTLDTDVDPYDSYTDYADTDTGCYCKIIENLLADNPTIAIVLVNIYHAGSSDDTTRAVIEQIGARYSLPVINTMSLAYSVNPAYHNNIDNVHLSKAGYLALAHLISNGLRKYCEDNPMFVNKGMSRG